MKIQKTQNAACFIVGFCLLASLCSCLTSQKMDAYVSGQYGDQLPKQNKKMKSDIVVNSAIASREKYISTTVSKTTHVLPLVVYWEFDYRHTCNLNPEIPVSAFANALNSMAAKISQKLNGQRLELTVEQTPSAFAIVD